MARASPTVVAQGAPLPEPVPGPPLPGGEPVPVPLPAPMPFPRLPGPPSALVPGPVLLGPGSELIASGAPVPLLTAAALASLGAGVVSRQALLASAAVTSRRVRIMTAFLSRA